MVVRRFDSFGSSSSKPTHMQVQNYLLKEVYELNEGWGIYESLGDNGWEWRIERHDCERVFSSDEEAVKYVVSKALNGSDIHKKVLLFMVENADIDELKFMLKAISH